MIFLARSILQNIEQKIKASPGQGAEGRSRLFVTMPSFSADLSLKLAVSLGPLVFLEEDGGFLFCIVEELWESWTEKDRDLFSDLRENGWFKISKNPTEFRNASTISSKDTGLTVIVGVDKTIDSGSLFDFYLCDQNRIWEETMQETFLPWIEGLFGMAQIEYDERAGGKIDRILKVIKDLGFGDLEKISRFLETMQPSIALVSRAKDVEKVLLQNLSSFGLPNCVGLHRKEKDLGKYFESAIGFFNYDDFINEATKTKVLSNLEALKAMTTSDARPVFDEQELSPSFKEGAELLIAIEQYINEEDLPQRENLKKVDFICIHDKILKMKEDPEKHDGGDDKGFVKRLSGSPIEVVLTALWYSLSDYKEKIGRRGTPNLNSISISGSLFKHNDDMLPEEGSMSPAESQEHARSFLKKLVGGIDEFFRQNYLIFNNPDDTQASIESNLFWDEIGCSRTKTGEPFFEFEITITAAGHSPLKKKFAWKLPETQSYRVAKELIELAYTSLEPVYRESEALLPVFLTPYHEEMMRAKDEDETKKVLLHSIRDIRAKADNLITEDWLARKNPLPSSYKDLGDRYMSFLGKAYHEGLHSIFQSSEVEVDSAWHLLERGFKQASDDFLQDERYSKSSLGAMLMRAFLMIARPKAAGTGWVSNPFERSAIVTVLHPSVLDMLYHQILFLFGCFNYLAPLEWRSTTIGRPFQVSKWNSFKNLASIRMPLLALLEDEHLKVNSRVSGQELIHRVGSTGPESESLSTRLLLRYEGFDDGGDLTDQEIFKESKESQLFLQILKNYFDTHPHANDGISLSFYRNEDFQPVISALHDFLAWLGKEHKQIFSQERERPYNVSMVVFSESAEDSGISRWIEQWKERWQEAETNDKFAVYRKCRFSVAHRILASGSEKHRDLCRMIQINGLDVDISFLCDFLTAGLGANDFKKVAPFDICDRTLKFPIIEKIFCTENDPSRRLKRSRVISNQQFEISSKHLEILNRLKHEDSPVNDEHVLVGSGDFEPWIEVLDAVHKKSEWVVCIDPNIDEMLIAEKAEAFPERSREIIGFGSGVGEQGEFNYTISTEHFSFVDLRARLGKAILDKFTLWSSESAEKAAESVLKEAKDLSGLSVVKATGVGKFLHEFISFALANKLIGDNGGKKPLCSKVITLDAYQHWFNYEEDASRPDLLWLVADIDQDKRIKVQMHLLECKLGEEEHEEDRIVKAKSQIQNGLDILIPAFLPRLKEKTDDDRPDQRYWWLQLHRLIASRTIIESDEKDSVMTALERLVEGDFDISWNAGVLNILTDQASRGFQGRVLGHFENSRLGNLSFGIYSMGHGDVLSLCTGEGKFSFDWPDKPLIFYGIGGSPSPEQVDVQKTILENLISAGEPVGPSSGDFVKGEVEKTEDEVPKNGPPSSGTAENLREIPERILLGTTTHSEKSVFWEFGHKGLTNRHMLIFGASGMGKTYAIQCLLCELARKEQNCLVMDYTNGFLPAQLEAETLEILNPLQELVIQKPLAVNPFKPQVLDLGGGYDAVKESDASAAKRITSTLKHLYGTIGDQQYGVLVEAITSMLKEHGERSSLELLLQYLDNEAERCTSAAQRGVVFSVISKLKPFVQEKPFSSSEESIDWDSIFEDPDHRCRVFQFAGIDSISSRQIIEFAMWDLNAFARARGHKNLPKVLVLDEVQNLDLSDDAPVGKYMTEGRKFGLSLILATQRIKNIKSDELGMLFQAAHKLFFRPADTEIQENARIIASAMGEPVAKWSDNLSALNLGECYSLGPALNEASGSLRASAFKIKITPLGDRFGHE